MNYWSIILLIISVCIIGLGSYKVGRYSSEKRKVYLDSLILKNEKSLKELEDLTKEANALKEELKLNITATEIMVEKATEYKLQTESNFEKSIKLLKNIKFKEN